MPATQALESLDGVKNEKPRASRHQRFSKIILYYYLLVYLKKNFTFSHMVPFCQTNYIKRINFRGELVFGKKAISHVSQELDLTKLEFRVLE